MFLRNWSKKKGERNYLVFRCRVFQGLVYKSGLGSFFSLFFFFLGSETREFKVCLGSFYKDCEAVRG